MYAPNFLAPLGAAYPEDVAPDGALPIFYFELQIYQPYGLSKFQHQECRVSLVRLRVWAKRQTNHQPKFLVRSWKNYSRIC
jgi:hypothetical protein